MGSTHCIILVWVLFVYLSSGLPKFSTKMQQWILSHEKTCNGNWYFPFTDMLAHGIYYI